MSKYRKRPVVIEAKLWNGTRARMCEIVEWGEPVTFVASQDDDDDTAEQGWALSIETLEGSMLASVGDFIIKGVQGELYPCKPDIFMATYERVAA